jgi:hypothetical protein
MVGIPGFIKRSPRVDLRRPAVLIDSDGVETAVTVLDISSGGFRLEVKEAPLVGDTVKLRVERGHEFPAEIRWAQGTEAGGVFVGPVDPVDWREPRVLPFQRSR